MNELESALAGLVPAAPRLDRDALMYAAGRASRPRRLLWPLLACGFALVAIVTEIRLETRTPEVIERIVVVHESTPASSPTETGSDGQSGAEPIDREQLHGPYGSPYLELRRQILLHGDLPMPTSPGNIPADAGPPPMIDPEFDLLPGRFNARNRSYSPR